MDRRVRDRFTRGTAKGVKIDEPSLAQQQFAQEADINVITERYLRKGIPMNTGRPMKFGDFVGLDLQEMMNTVNDAKAMFAGLPARVRRRFNEDPVSLLRFLENDENYEEAVKLGLVEKAEEKSDAPKGEVKGEQAAPAADPEANPHKKGGEPDPAP